MGILTAAFLLALSTGVSGQDSFPTAQPEAALVDGTNTTGILLAAKLLPRATGGNIVISPYSAVMAHLMLAYGCHGEDRRELLTGLGLAGLADDGAILYSAGLQKTLTGIAGSPFTSADAFMTVGDAKPVEAFKKLIQGTFGGDFFAFSAGEAPDKIKNRIPQLLDQSTTKGPVEMFLLNAATYDGEWVDPFSPYRRFAGEHANFTTAAGKRIIAQMMYREAPSTNAVSESTFDAISLPYKGKAFSMLVMLPHVGAGPGAALTELEKMGIREVLAGMKAESVQVRLPKFTMRGKYDLTASLRSLGINRIFDKFDASDMLAEPSPPISDRVSVDLQQAYIEVDEQGTKAGVATAVAMTTGFDPVGSVKPFIVDRPFVYAIVHNDSGLMIFLGVCSTPPPAQKGD